LKNNSFNIINTFDIFNAETVGIIKDRIIKFMLIEAENFFIAKSSVSAEINKNDNVQFTVFNDKKMYNLLTSAWLKHQKRLRNESIKC
jgi:hypothetical protein